MERTTTTATETRPGDEGLRRTLKNRHIQMIALGGTIGVGLFLQSGALIQQAGPALVLAYAACGVLVYLVMRATGQLAVHRPVAGSYRVYAEEYLGPRIAYVTAWTVWLMWVTTAMAELTAAGIYLQYWFPHVPAWSVALLALVVLHVANLVSARSFGELEFWFSLIKVLTILVLIAVGVGILVFGFSALGHDARPSNLWSHGGVFPTGLGAALLAFQGVVFAYSGVELVAVTAGEAENPEKTIPSAIRKVVWRIGIFYCGAILILLCLMPWTHLSGDRSPFVQVFSGIGLPGAAGIVNFVVLTATLSGCNSAMYTMSRVVYDLSRRGQGPRALGRTNRRRVPAAALTASSVVLALGVLLSYVTPEKVFTYFVSVSTVGVIWTWGSILASSIRLGQRVKRGEEAKPLLSVPGAPWTGLIALAVLVATFVSLAFGGDTRPSFVVGVVWLVLVSFAAHRWYVGTQAGRSAPAATAATAQIDEARPPAAGASVVEPLPTAAVEP